MLNTRLVRSKTLEGRRNFLLTSAHRPAYCPLFCFEGADLLIPLYSQPGNASSPRPGCCDAIGVTLFENCIASTSIFVLPSYKEPTVDALAPDTDEGRGWLRKATGSCRPSFDPWISEWGNPAPVIGRYSCLNKIGQVEGTGGIETSKYPEEKKTTVTP